MDGRECSAGILAVLSRNVLSTAQTLHLPADAHIVTANTPSCFFFVLVEGSAKLVHDDPTMDPVIIDIYHEGDFFGEMEMIGITIRDRSIIAMTPVTLYQMTKNQFFAEWQHNPYFSRQLFAMHCQRLLRSGDDKVNADRDILRDRLFRLIQENRNASGYFRYSKQILAEMVGTSMRSLNRSLRELEQTDQIVLTEGTIRLHDELTP